MSDPNADPNADPRYSKHSTLMDNILLHEFGYKSFKNSIKDEDEFPEEDADTMPPIQNPKLSAMVTIGKVKVKKGGETDKKRNAKAQSQRGSLKKEPPANTFSFNGQFENPKIVKVKEHSLKSGRRNQKSSDNILPPPNE